MSSLKFGSSLQEKPLLSCHRASEELAEEQKPRGTSFVETERTGGEAGDFPVEVYFPLGSLR